ncbi:MAG TPA: glutamate ABC transporter substrate-binding protein [Nocardioides sp.]|nr:glutamate ABC transporter substrate-binding protein [Nocardioides sp.]
MRFQKVMAAAAATVLGLTLAACGDDDEGGTDLSDVEEASDLTGFPKELADAGSIKIGVKIDQPGIGYREPGADAPSGFDIEMGRIVAARLGIEEGDIEWVETVSDNREPFLQNGTVDIVIASYSITDERRAVVGQAGPYYVTGQQLLVREDDKETITGPDDLADVKVCSVEGSTSLETVEKEYGAKPVPFATYSECVEQLENETVDVVTTDGAILLGYAAQKPDELEVVGEPFSEERYGIGYPLDAEGMCEFLNETIEGSFEDGTWDEGFEATLGESGVETPEHPTPDPCE